MASEAKGGRNAAKGWIVLVALTLCGIIMILNQYKAPSMMSQLMGYFNVQEGTAGWLMSVFALAGIVLALPAAGLLNKYGPKTIGLIGLACSVIGVAVGATASVVTVMIIGRVIEGAGVALMGVVGPSIIAMYFSREKSGLPMGIWNLWYPTGAYLGVSIAYPIAAMFGKNGEALWQTWWWFGDILSLIAFLIFAVVVSMPKEGEVSVSDAERAKPHVAVAAKFSDGLKVKRMWILGVSFMFMVFSSLSFLTWTATYLVQAFGMDSQAAGTMASYGFLSSIPMGIVTGLILLKCSTIKQRNVMVIIAAIASFVYVPCYYVPLDLMTPYLWLCGFVTVYVAGVVWSMVPLTMPLKATIPVGCALVSIFQGFANLLAPPVVGYIVQSSGWGNVCYLIAGTAALGLVFAIVYIVAKRPVFEEDMH